MERFKNISLCLVLLCTFAYRSTAQIDNINILPLNFFPPASQLTNVPILQNDENNIDSNFVQYDQVSVARAVYLFNKYFRNEVKRCKVLSNLYRDVARELTREEIAGGVFYLSTIMAARDGYPYPANHSATSVRYITSYADTTTPELLLDIYSNTASQFLYEKKLLYCSNSKMLANLYAFNAREAAKRIAKADCPRSKLTAIVVGQNDFFSDGETLEQSDDIARTGFIYSDLWKDRKGTGKVPQNISEPTCCSRPFLETTDRICQLTSKPIDEFKAAFFIKLNNSYTLKDLFNILFSVTSKELSRALFYVSLYLMQLCDVKDAAYLADFSSRFAESVQVLQPEIVETVHVNFVSKYLDSQKILNSQNAGALAEKFGEILENSAKAIVDPLYPRSKVVAIRYALRLFLSQIGAVTTAEDEEKLSLYYGNEWRCQSLGSNTVQKQELSLSENVISNKSASEPKCYKEENKINSSYTSSIKPLSSSTSRAVELFNGYFQIEVRKSAELSDLFDVARNVSREEIANAIFYLVTTFVAQTGYPSPAESAASSQRYVTSIGDNPTPQLLLYVYSNAVSVFLDQKGYLYEENARNLAARYALLMKEAANRIVKKDSPRSKLTAIVIGLNDFYKEQELFGTAEIDEIAVLYGNLWLGRNGTSTSSNKASNPNFKSKSPLLNTSEKFCSINSKAIRLFTETFHNAVLISEALENLFQVQSSLTSAEISRGLFYVSIYFLQQRRVKNAAEEAEFVARYSGSIKVLKPCVVERVHSYSMAKLLESQKILTTKNAKSLAEKFAEIMELSANIIVDSRYPKSKIVAFRYAFGLYYKLIGAVEDQDNAFPKFDYYYGSEWKCQSLKKLSE